MATPWDDSLKVLINDNAQDFATWLLDGAIVQRKLATEFQGRKLVADILLEVLWQGEELLLHIEIQSENDPDMALRLLEYNLRARRTHKRPVYSCTIYLRQDGEVPASPLRWVLSNGKEILTFHFLNIELYKLTPDELRHLGLPGLLPLMLLTQGGATRQIDEEIMTDLERAGKNDAVGAFSLLASLVLTSPIDLGWLRKRAHIMHEAWQDNWLVQELTKGAVEKAREEERRALEEEHKAREAERKVLEQERQQRLQSLRDLLLAFVERRFSDAKLLRIAQRQMALIDDPRILQSLLLKVGFAETPEKAKDYLVDWSDADEEQS
ncbi:MAG: hypothetical protein JOZ71_14550 [Ktedonobacteraceae bacterium]|nr:hypothetical protein [Ktedonobacteraceae bacterium]